MAEAIISGMLAGGVCASQICAIDKADNERTRALAQRHGIITQRRFALENLSGADVVVLAVKPKDTQPALAEYHQVLPKDGLLISIVAGVTLRQLRAAVPAGMKIVRAMPNTSVRIGMGVTAMAATPGLTEEHWRYAESVFSTVGLVERVPETALDAVTAVSGSGPAYVYLFAEGLEQAAIGAGLAPELARRLVLQTIVGAAHMLKHSGEEPLELRRQVTSPNGTTQAALDTLQAGRFVELIDQAVGCACRRSSELSAGLRESAATD